jgi:hypothetical protein
MHRQLYRHLSDAGLLKRLVSDTSDGHESEVARHTIMRAEAPERITISLPNAGVPLFSFEVILGVFDGVPTVLRQDANHFAKTVRNQQDSGARALTLGAHFFSYDDLQEVVERPDSPLPKRDVYKQDKQDDRRAARYLSSDMLSHVGSHTPGARGFLLYLFVMGELFTACQSRSLSHTDRLRKLLTTRFVLVAWHAHIELHPDYTHNNQFISPSSYKTALNLVDTSIGLMHIYRDHFETHPLLLWLHSTEVVEHWFGVMRQVKPDFTAHDIPLMHPKVAGYMRSFKQDWAKSTTTNASGYCHTYADRTDLDLDILRGQPSKTQIASILAISTEDATHMCAWVGISIQMLPNVASPMLDQPVENVEEDRTSNGIDDILVGRSIEELLDRVDAADAPVQGILLQRLLHGAECHVGGMTSTERTAYDTAVYAAAALNANEQIDECAPLLRQLPTTNTLQFIASRRS